MKQTKIDDKTPQHEMTKDDMDVLQYVLQNVRGAYPDSPYRPADYLDELETEC